LKLTPLGYFSLRKNAELRIQIAVVFGAQVFLDEPKARIVFRGFSRHIYHLIML